MNGGGAGSTGTGKGTSNHTKSEYGKRRAQVLSEIKDQFKDKTYNKTIIDENGKKVMIEVGTNSYSRGHLAKNIVDYHAMDYRDAPRLSSIFKNASFVEDSGLKHERDDQYVHFYYFKARGRNLYFHVGKGISESGYEYYRLYALSKTI